MGLWVSVPIGAGIRVGGQLGGGPKKKGPGPGLVMVLLLALSLLGYAAVHYWWVAAIIAAAVVAVAVWAVLRVPRGERSQIPAAIWGRIRRDLRV